MRRDSVAHTRIYIYTVFIYSAYPLVYERQEHELMLGGAVCPGALPPALGAGGLEGWLNGLAGSREAACI